MYVKPTRIYGIVYGRKRVNTLIIIIKYTNVLLQTKIYIFYEHERILVINSQMIVCKLNGIYQFLHPFPGIIKYRKIKLLSTSNNIIGVRNQKGTAIVYYQEKDYFQNKTVFYLGFSMPQQHIILCKICWVLKKVWSCFQAWLFWIRVLRTSRWNRAIYACRHMERNVAEQTVCRIVWFCWFLVRV